MNTSPIRTRVLVAAAVLAAAVGVGGCSFSVHPTLTEEQVEQTLSDRLHEIVGQRPDAIDCPDELDGVAGTSLQCELTAGADRYPVNVTVTSVDGTNVDFDFEVADRPV